MADKPPTMFPHCIPPVSNLDSPPSTDEGFIAQVRFGYSSAIIGDHQHKACQACGEPIQMNTEHVQATVWVENAIGMAAKAPVFCDKNCWTSWASRE